MSTGTPFAIPRWQWRTFGPGVTADLGRRLATLPGVEVRRSEETHLVCRHSAHHAWLRGEVLELRWRKEVGPDGCELWATIVQAHAPFPPPAAARLLSAWGIVAQAPPAEERRSAAAFLAGPLARLAAIRPVRLLRRARTGAVDGLECTCETITVGGGDELESVAVEHEDPSLIAQFIAEHGLAARGNISLLHALKAGVERLTDGSEG